jgi:SAM-dependent methyltransferase
MHMKIDRRDANVPQTSNDGETRVLIFLNLLRAISPGRLLDLGAGHCKFSLWGQRLGFDVTAVDARTDRVPARETLGSIKFIQSDVRDFDFAGFEVILCLGLIYHLDIADQLATLLRCARARATVILDTQVHIAEKVPADLDEAWARQPVERDGYTGVAFPERDNLMASVGNKFSFWHTENSWLRLFENAGFAEATVVTPLFQTKYGARGFYVLK